MSAQRIIPDNAICFFKDGNKWCCCRGNFENLQESNVGFGDTFEDAMQDLEKREPKGLPCVECNGKGWIEQNVQIGEASMDAPCDCIFCDATGVNR